MNFFTNFLLSSAPPTYPPPPNYPNTRPYKKQPSESSAITVKQKRLS